MDASENADRQTEIACLKLLVGLAACFVVGATVFAVLTLKKLERVVAVAENMNAKVDRAVEAAAPLGHAAVQRGIQAVESVDAQDLGKATTDGLKDMGRAAKEHALEQLKKIKVDGHRGE